MQHIFDLSDLDDMPNDLKKEVRRLGIRRDTVNLLSLFDIKQHLTIDEIIVGMMRKYGVKKKRLWVSSTIYNLKRREMIKDVEGEKKVYQKCEKPE
jgi:hypothetical protein